MFSNLHFRKSASSIDGFFFKTFTSSLFEFKLVVQTVPRKTPSVEAINNVARLLCLESTLHVLIPAEYLTYHNMHTISFRKLSGEQLENESCCCCLTIFSVVFIVI